jgi:hypothetical protein
LIFSKAATSLYKLNNLYLIKEMKPRLSSSRDADALVQFFAENFRPEEETPGEFSCPLGVAAAARRKEIALTEDEGKILAAQRFFRKRDGSLSFYQSATAPGFPQRETEKLWEFLEGSPR